MGGEKPARLSSVEGPLLEMKNLILGARIERVHQLDLYTHLFTIYCAGATMRLVMSMSKRGRGFHLLFEKVHKDYLCSSNVTDLFKKYLAEGRIREVRSRGNIVELIIRRGEEYTLSCDFGDAAVTLRDGDTLIHAVGRRERGGEIPQDAELPGTGALRVWRLEEDAPVSVVEEERVAGQGNRFEGGFEPAQFPQNERASQTFIHFRNELLQRELKRRIKAVSDRVRRLLCKLEEERAEMLEKDMVLGKGELIKTYLQTLQKGMRSAVLTGAEGKAVEVDLDPRLSPLENMNAYFKRYRKLKNRERYIKDNIRRQEEKLNALADYERKLAQNGLPDIRRSPSDAVSLLDEARAGKGIREALAIFHRAAFRRAMFGRGAPLRPAFSREAATRPATHRTAGSKAESGRGEGKKELLHFASRTGKVIYVGRNARENEFLSTRFARGNDLWFHALGGAGSHVILRYDKKGEFRESDIADAALLALYFSRLRKKGEGEIVYTHCKFVRKPRDSKQGMVVYHSNKTRNVRLEKQALRILMEKDAL